LKTSRSYSSINESLEICGGIFKDHRVPRFELRTWEANPDANGGHRARRAFRFTALIPDPIAAIDPALPSSVVALVADAERATLTLNENPPQVASLEVLARRLLRAEAVASSWIEGVQLSNRRLARAEAEDAGSRDVTAKAVLGNVAAMEHIVALADSGRPLGLPDLLGVHRALMELTPDARGAGELRDRQNWIGGNPYTPLDASFIPPPPEYVFELVQDLLRFIERDDLSPALQAAIAHAQFEAIHPFADGNGRVGRALIHFVLRRRRLASRFVPPVSLILAARSNSYIAGLNAYAHGKVQEWLDVFARALSSAAIRSAELGDLIAKLQADWRERAGRPRKDSSAAALIAALPAYPVLTVEAAARVLGRSVQAANEALAKLEKAGIVKRTRARKWGRTFEAAELLDLVAAFEKELALPDEGAALV
jgi:Fic family protein